MAQRMVKKDRKAVRKMTDEILADTVTDATLDIVNKYRHNAMVAWFCFLAMIPIACLAYLWGR
jgi:hypothetical protein